MRCSQWSAWRRGRRKAAADTDAVGLEAGRSRSRRAPPAGRVDGRVPAPVRSHRASRRLSRPRISRSGLARWLLRSDWKAAQISATPTLVELSFGVAAAPAQLHAPRPAETRRPRRDRATRGSGARGGRRAHRRRRARRTCGHRCPTAETARGTSSSPRTPSPVAPSHRSSAAGWREVVAGGVVGLLVGVVAQLARRTSRAEPMVAPLAAVVASFSAAVIARLGLERVAGHRHAGRADHVPAGDVAHDRRARDRDGASPVGCGEHGERRRSAPRPRVRRRRRAIARGALVRNRRARGLAAELHRHATPRGICGRPRVHRHVAGSVQGGAGDVRGDPPRRLGQRCRPVVVRGGGRDVRRGALGRNRRRSARRHRCAGHRSSSSSQAC